MYLFPLELDPVKEGFGMDDKVYSSLAGQGCINPDTTAPDPGTTTKPPWSMDGSGNVTDDPTYNPTDGSGNVIGGGGAKPPDQCQKIIVDKVDKSKTILDIVGQMRGKLDALSAVIAKFDPIPKEWTFQKDIDGARNLLMDIEDRYTEDMNTTDESKYSYIVERFKMVDKLIEKIKADIKKAQDMIKAASEPGPSGGSQDETFGLDQFGGQLGGTFTEFGAAMNRPITLPRSVEAEEQILVMASRAMDDAAMITGEISKLLYLFKNEQGTLTVDLLAEYDRIYDGTGIAAQNAELERQKQAAKAALAKSTADTANLIKDAQSPGFFMSMLESIIYIDPTSNPNFVYKTEKPANPALEQARQIVYYIAYAVIAISIIMFLSTKTFVMPFLQTFIFWFKRYFVFLAWIIVVGLIYVFMTNWFTWIIRENVRYMAFVVNPLLHPGVHQIWHSKYKYWIKIMVYGLASMAFFVSAIFFTAVILFLIAPLFLLLLWASGQLMSYFEKEELDE